MEARVDEVLGRVRPAFRQQPVVAAVSAERHSAARRSRADTRPLLEARDDLLEGLLDRPRLWIGGPGQPDHRRQHSGRLEPGRQMLEVQRAADQQPGARQQGERQRDLSRDQHVAQPIARRTLARHAPAEQGLRALACRAQRRDHSAKQARGE